MTVAVPGVVPKLEEVEIEQAILGSVLSNNALFWQVHEILCADDFSDPMHRRVWTVISENITSDRPADARILAAQLRTYAEELRDSSNGFDLPEYLRLLVHAPRLPIGVQAYARTISDLACRRRIVEEATAAIERAYFERETGTDQIADTVGEALYEAAHRAETGKGPEPLIDVIWRASHAAENARLNPDRAKITTGIPSVDAKLGGFFPRDLHVLGAASSMGKSGLVGQMALSASRAGYVVAFFSIEMASEEFATRYLAVDIGVPANRITEGKTSEADTLRISEATQNYADGKFFLDGSSNISMAQIRARSQAIRRRNGRVDLIVIDHLRLVRPSDHRAPEHERLDQVTKDAKALAKDLECAVLVIAPVNRELWKRESHRPIISDLYGASAIEYNADHVWFLHREEFYLEREQPDQSNAEAYTKWIGRLEAAKGRAEVFGAKRRGGPLGSAHLRFDAPLVRFLEEGEPLPAQGAMF